MNIYSSAPGAVTRTTQWCQVLKNQQPTWTHRTETKTPRGLETTTRWLESSSVMILRRTLEMPDGESVESSEHFDQELAESPE